ncbi:hypothetical protein BDN72DRAFT_112332 [Pluteus cervinus]|uniref:Uncharacterized protein n=1 Tax=Pluteus cervinus TaxID=181527 RepID=A0ACD3AMR1_9AGAR|nr:hypothetical protein BDN72DRAFT_112332 [Pluteus cervinus]
MSAIQHTLRGILPLAAIHHLPMELLTYIFLLVQGSLDNSYSGWIAIAGTCRDWRNIAISTPSLWSIIGPDHDKNAVQDWLMRSKNYPLSVNRNVSQQQHLTPLRKILNEMLRIRILRLTIRPILWDKVQDFISLKAPMLEELSIKYPEGRRLRGRIVIPQTIFSDCAPLLTRVTISRCLFSLNSPIFRGLTGLCIENPICRLDLETILQALQQMPQLLSLALHRSFYASMFSASSGSKTLSAVTLPCLKTLDVSDAVLFEPGEIIEGIDLLSNLRYPATAAVMVTLYVVGLERSERGLITFRELLLLYNRQYIGTGLPIKGIFFQAHPYRVRIQLCHQFKEDILLQFTQRSPDLEWDYTPLIESLSTLTLSEVSWLKINTVLPSTIWRRVLSQLVNLQDLTIYEDGADSFLDYLNEYYSSSPAPFAYADSDDCSGWKVSASSDGNEDEDTSARAQPAEGGDDAQVIGHCVRVIAPGIPYRLSKLTLDGIRPEEHPLRGVLQGLIQKREFGPSLDNLQLFFYGKEELEMVQPFRELANYFAYSFKIRVPQSSDEETIDLNNYLD